MPGRPLTCGRGFPEPPGARPGKHLCPLPYHLFPPKGISFPLMFSTVAVGSQVLGTQLENGLLLKYPPSAVWWGGPGLCTDELFGLLKCDKYIDFF